MPGLIGNIGGQSGADFSPYQRELERRSQLVIADMKRRQEEKRLELERDLGLRQAELAETQEARFDREGREQAELARDKFEDTKEARKEARVHDKNMQKRSHAAQERFARQGEQREIRREERKEERDDELFQREKEEENARRESMAKVHSWSNKVASSVYDAKTPEEAMAKIEGILDGSDLSPVERAEVIAKAPQMVQAFREHRRNMVLLDQQIKVDGAKVEQIERQRKLENGKFAVATGDPSDERVARGQALKAQIAELRNERDGLGMQMQRLANAEAGYASTQQGARDTFGRGSDGGPQINLAGQQQMEAIQARIGEIDGLIQTLEGELTGIYLELGKKQQ